MELCVDQARLLNMLARGCVWAQLVFVWWSETNVWALFCLSGLVDGISGTRALRVGKVGACVWWPRRPWHVEVLV